MQRLDHSRLLRSGLSVILLGAACGDDGVATSDPGNDGEPGNNGNDGKDGEPGNDGKPGNDGQPGNDGNDGQPGNDGNDGEPGQPGADGDDGQDLATAPRSGVVALAFADDLGTGATDIAGLIKILVQQHTEDKLPVGLQFPLAPAATDTVRAIAGLRPTVLARWLDPLGFDETPEAPRFGANNDYIAYFGDGWDKTPGDAPQWHGDGASGWFWVNHEYVSGDTPTGTTAPTGQHLTLASHLRRLGVLSNDITSDVWDDAALGAHVLAHKQQIGGSWMHAVQDPATGAWALDRGQPAVRYDATSQTLTAITGMTFAAPDTDDQGAPLAENNLAAGIMGDCSGGQTPWGTIISAEENVQDYYGDLEECWSGQQFVAAAGCDPGAAISLDNTPTDDSAFGIAPDAATRHARDRYGYLVEIDPGQPPGEWYGKTDPGVGHQKLGSIGRAHWENAAFAVDADWKLVPNQPITIYSADDRRSGRIYKWTSSKPYQDGMKTAQIRDLLGEGNLYVSHFADLDNTTGTTLLGGKEATESAPGKGQWLLLSLANNTDNAPNAGTSAGPANTKIGAALQNDAWNTMGSFTSDDQLRQALFTASNKLGVMELNRPEDLEWNPKDPSGTPRLYIAFTKHGAQTALAQDGTLYAPDQWAMQAPKRADAVGTIFALEEQNPGNPAASKTFTYFKVLQGTQGDGPFDVANPDNLLIDREGGVWFGTDGNWGTNGHADGLYYLDLDPAHKPGQPGVVTPSWGVPFRVVAGPGDSEATGPAFSSDQRSLFFAVQHPGEGSFSQWPGTP